MRSRTICLASVVLLAATVSVATADGVRFHGSELMFSYGETDPWSSEPFRLGPGTRDSYVYVQPAARATLARWAGL